MPRSHSLHPFPRLHTLPPRISARKPATLTLLRMCQTIQELKQLHAHCLISGLVRHPAFARRLMESYVAMLEVNDASLIFHRIKSPDVFVYNTMIRGLILAKRPFDSLLLYKKLLLECLLPDSYTFTFILKACSHSRALSEGQQLHSRIIKTGLAPDTHVHSSLIHMYSNSGRIQDSEQVLRGFSEENVAATNSMISGYLTAGQVDKARAVFDSMQARDIATWSAIITGYTKNDLHTEALLLFGDMMASSHNYTLFNESLLVSLLSACATTGALQQGRWLHTYVDKTAKFQMSTNVRTALIDMYAKCGCLDCSYGLFQNTKQRDIVAYGAMISGFAIHGQAKKCIQLFEEMTADGMHPNEVIFTSMLSVCSHTGDIEGGLYYFQEMVGTFKIKPSIEHYGCVVDLLSRAGWLKEAEIVIKSMTERPNSVIWGAFLNGCRMYKDVKRGFWAFKKLTELEPEAGDRWKLAGIMFVNAGHGEIVDGIRKAMNRKEMTKTCGSSFVEVDGEIHEFRVGDTRNNNKAAEIYNMLEVIKRVLLGG